MTEFVSADAAVSAIALPAQAWPLVQPKDTDGVRVLTAANGKVNALSRPLRVALLTALAVNLRMAMYSAALVPHIGHAPLGQRALMA